MPKGRPRFSGRRSKRTGRLLRPRTPERTRAYETSVAAAARAAVARLPRPWDLDGDFEAQISVSHGDKRRRDVDNAAKVYLDALNGIAWHDDDQVSRLTVEKHYSKESPCAVVTVVRRQRLLCGGVSDKAV